MKTLCVCCVVCGVCGVCGGVWCECVCVWGDMTERDRLQYDVYNDMLY